MNIQPLKFAAPLPVGALPARVTVEVGRSLREQAYDALDQAMTAHGLERRGLIDKAARLHWLAVEAEARENTVPLSPMEAQ